MKLLIFLLLACQNMHLTSHSSFKMGNVSFKHNKIYRGVQLYFDMITSSPEVFSLIDDKLVSKMQGCSPFMLYMPHKVDRDLFMRDLKSKYVVRDLKSYKYALGKYAMYDSLQLFFYDLYAICADQIDLSWKGESIKWP